MMFTPTRPANSYLSRKLGTNRFATGFLWPYAMGEPFTLELWVRLDAFTRGDQPGILFGISNETGMELIRSKPGDRYAIGFYIGGKSGLYVAAELKGSWETELVQPIPAPFHFACTYDGSQSAGGMNIYLNGWTTTTSVKSDVAPGSDVGGEVTLGTNHIPCTVFSAHIYGVEQSASWAQARADALPSVDAIADYYFTGNRYAKALFHPDRFKQFHFGNEKGRIMDCGIWGGWYYSNHIQGVNEYSSLNCNTPTQNINYYPIAFYAEGKTYLGTSGWGGPGWHIDNYLCVFDHDTKVMSIVARATSSLAPTNNKDYHQVPSVIVNADTGLPFLSRERGHTSPFGIYGFPPVEDEMPFLSSFSDASAYNHLAYLSGRLISYSRNGLTGGNQEQQRCFYSDDNGATWQGGHIVVDLNTSHWAYLEMWNYPDEIYIVVRLRNQDDNVDGSVYPARFLLKTTDGVHFSDYRGQVMKDAGAGERWTESELRSYALMGSTSPDETVTPNVSGWGSHKLADGTLVFAFINGQTGVRELVHVAPDGTENRMPLDPSAKSGSYWPISDTEIMIISREQRDDGNNYQGVLYRAGNDYVPVDSGEVVTTRGWTYDKLNVSTSVTPGSPRLLTANVVKKDWTDRMMLWAYEYTP